MSLLRILFITLVSSFVWGGTTGLLAQNTGAPDMVKNVINNIDLGVRVNGGVQFRRRDLQPLQERTLDYLKKPVSGALSHGVPYYGVGVALRGYGAKLTFVFQSGSGVQRVHWVQFEDDSNAIPYEPNFQTWSLRAQYFVTDWVGVGLSYRWKSDNLDQSAETPIKGERVGGGLFWVSSRRKLMSLYLPVQKEWGRVRLFGRIGSSVFGRTNEFYSTFFVRYQLPDHPGRPNVDPRQTGTPIQFDGNQQSLNAQFARAGVEAPLWQTSVRGSFEVERLAVPDWTTTWSYGVRLEVGLPF